MAIERAPPWSVTSGEELETLNLSYVLLKKAVQNPKLYSVAIFVQGWVFNCTGCSYFTEGKCKGTEGKTGLTSGKEEKNNA